MEILTKKGENLTVCKIFTFFRNIMTIYSSWNGNSSF